MKFATAEPLAMHFRYRQSPEALYRNICTFLIVPNEMLRASSTFFLLLWTKFDPQDAHRPPVSDNALWKSALLFGYFTYWHKITFHAYCSVWAEVDPGEVNSNPISISKFRDIRQMKIFSLGTFTLEERTDRNSRTFYKRTVTYALRNTAEKGKFQGFISY